jgi:hypothetical protein
MSGNAVADDTSYALRGWTEPMLMYGASSLDLGGHLFGFDTKGQIRWGWRHFPVLTSKPDSSGWTLDGTAETGDGPADHSISLTTTTDSLWVQAGIFASLSSAGSPEAIQYDMYGTLPGSGWLVARQRLLLRPSASKVVLPIGNPFPCAGVTGMMVGLRFMGISGTITDLATKVRLFKTGDRMYPDAWSTVSAESNVTSDSNVNSNGSVTSTGAILAQAGLEYSTTGTDPRGAVEAIVAVKDS